MDCSSKFVITADEGVRGGKNIKLKTIVDDAVRGVEGVQSVLVFRRTGNAVPMLDGRDEYMHDLLPKVMVFYSFSFSMSL